MESSLNGPLSGISYRVRYGVLGKRATEIHVNSSGTSGSSVQQYTLRNLEYGAAYFVQVAAESSNGTGPYSTTFTETTITISEQYICGTCMAAYITSLIQFHFCIVSFLSL